MDTVWRVCAEMLCLRVRGRSGEVWCVVCGVEVCVECGVGVGVVWVCVVWVCVVWCSVVQYGAVWCSAAQRSAVQSTGSTGRASRQGEAQHQHCLLYTSDAADE